MTDSILDSVKKVLMIAPEDTAFDVDILMHINSVFADLHQLGVGPSAGYSIQDSTQTWPEYIDGDNRLNSVASYMYLRVRLMFDPPETSHAREAFKNQAEKWEWLLNVHSDIATPVLVKVIDGGDPWVDD